MLQPMVSNWSQNLTRKSPRFQPRNVENSLFNYLSFNSKYVPVVHSLLVLEYGLLLKLGQQYYFDNFVLFSARANLFLGESALKLLLNFAK